MTSSLAEANELIGQQQLQIGELTKKLQSAQRNITMLQHQAEQLLSRVYGRRSEKLDPNQLMFDELLREALEQPPSLPEPSLEPSTTVRKRPKSSKRNHPGRIPIPEHLERVEIVLDIPEEEKSAPRRESP